MAQEIEHPIIWVILCIPSKLIDQKTPSIDFLAKYEITLFSR